MKTVTIIVDGIKFEVPNNDAPMYNNLGWQYVIKEYLNWDYTPSQISAMIEIDQNSLRELNLEIMIGDE